MSKRLPSISLLRKKDGRRIIVPRHDPIGKGLLMEIIAEAGLTKEDFLKLLEKV